MLCNFENLSVPDSSNLKNTALVTEFKNSNSCEMWSKIEIKEEEFRSDDLATNNERKSSVTMKRNSDNVAIKTELKSETAFSNYHVEQIKTEAEVGEQTLISDFGSQNKGESLSEDPVMKNNKYNFDHEREYKIEIKEEPLWQETEVCNNIKDGVFPPVKSSRLWTEEVSSTATGESTLPPAEVSGRDIRFYTGKNHLEYKHKKRDVTEMPTTDEYVLSEQCGKCSEGGEMSIRSLYLKQKTFIHQDKRRHKCKTCDKSFTRLSHLKRHYMIHEGKKPHRCNTCDKRFTQLSCLKIHNLIHEGKKPHKCKFCDKSFTHLSNFNKHNLIHEGKKPYQCAVCGKSFTHSSSLKLHNLIHEGKKPHQCKTCDKSFTQLSHLKRHYLVHKDNK